MYDQIAVSQPTDGLWVGARAMPFRRARFFVLCRTPRPYTEPGRGPMGAVLGMATQTPLPTLPVTITDGGDRERRQRLTSRARRLTQLG